MSGQTEDCITNADSEMAVWRPGAIDASAVRHNRRVAAARPCRAYDPYVLYRRRGS